MASGSGSGTLSFRRFGLKPTGDKFRMDEPIPAGFVTLLLEFSCKKCNRKFSVKSDVHVAYDDTFQCPSCRQHGRIVCSATELEGYWLEMILHGEFEKVSDKIKRGDILWKSNAQRNDRRAHFLFTTSGHGDYFMNDETYFSLFQTKPNQNAREVPYCTKKNLKLHDLEA